MNRLTLNGGAAAGLDLAARAGRLLVAGLLALAAALPLGAQSASGSDADASPRPGRASRAADANAASILGMTLSSSGTDRDTLGLLISNVTPGGPADRAGIDDGNRLAAINGVSLRGDAQAAGQRDASDALLRRLGRELAALQDGDDVTLRLFSAGRLRTVTLHPAIAAPARTAPARVIPSAAPRTDEAVQPASLATVADGITVLQSQLRRLEQGEGNTATLDSLTRIEQDLAAIRRRLRELQTLADRPAASRRSSDDLLPGLSLSAVADELVPYFGEGSETGLLVLKADESWDPIRPGDVILRVNGAAATQERLRSARNSRRAAEVDVLRRKRELTLTIDPAPERVER